MGLLDFLTGGRPEDKFAKAVIAEMRRQAPDIAARYDARSGTILHGEGGRAYVGNTFLDYQGLPPDRQAQMLVDYARDIINEGQEENLSYEAARPRLKPTVKNITHLINIQAEVTTPYRPLAGPLCVIAVVDSPTNMHLVHEAHLKRWGVSFDEVLDLAIENLRAESPLKFTRHEEGFWLSDYHDYFDASRLLLPELWSQLPVKGDPVAIAVERGILLATGSEEREVLKAMSEIAESTVDNGHRSLAYTALVWRAGAWAPLVFDPEAEPELRRAAVKQKWWDANVQKGALTAKLKRDGVKLRIADLLIEDFGTGRPFTFTQYRGECLLPEAEVVLAPGPRGEGLTPRRWADFNAVFGPLVARQGAYPPIFHVDGGSDEQLERLRNTGECPPGFEESDEGWIVITPTR